MPNTLGVLSSRIHVRWALTAGGRLGVGNDPRYQKTRCFDPFPFPAATKGREQVIGDLAEELDAHRKRVLAEHRDLTLTGLYNVLEKLRAGEPLSGKEADVHERGLVSIMKQLHERIDSAVFAAYGWQEDLADEEILAGLVALNRERRAEEAAGQVRWLRPAYQAPGAEKAAVMEAAPELGLPAAAVAVVAAEAGAGVWLPKALPARVARIRAALAEQVRPLNVEEIAGTFPNAKRRTVQDILNTLVALGLARRLDDNRYAP